MSERGVGECPENPGGHVWVSCQVDSRKPCKFCGRPGRDNTPLGGVHTSGGFFAEATAARSGMVGSLNTRRELTDAQEAKAAEIVAEKKRRDARAVDDGSARPSQVAGAKGRRGA